MLSRRQEWNLAVAGEMEAGVGGVEQHLARRSAPADPVLKTKSTATPAAVSKALHPASHPHPRPPPLTRRPPRIRATAVFQLGWERGQGAKEIWRNLARERPKFAHDPAPERNQVWAQFCGRSMKTRAQICKYCTVHLLSENTKTASTLRHTPGWNTV